MNVAQDGQKVFPSRMYPERHGAKRVGAYGPYARRNRGAERTCEGPIPSAPTTSQDAIGARLKPKVISVGIKCIGRKSCLAPKAWP